MERQAEVGKTIVFPAGYQELMLAHVTKKWKRSNKALEKGTLDEDYVAEKMWDAFKSIEINF